MNVCIVLLYMSEKRVCVDSNLLVKHYNEQKYILISIRLLYLLHYSINSKKLNFFYRIHLVLKFRLCVYPPSLLCKYSRKHVYSRTNESLAYRGFTWTVD